MPKCQWINGCSFMGKRERTFEEEQKTVWYEDPGREVFRNEAGKEVRSQNMEGHVTVNGLVSTHEKLRQVTPWLYVSA